MHFLLPTLLLSLFLSACFKDETISGQAEASDTWILRSLNGKTVPSRITLTFPEKGVIAGQAACNTYRAVQTAPLPWFEIGPIRATKRACDGLALEQEYLEVLAKMTLIELKQTTLLLSSDTGQYLEFAKTQANPI